MYLKGELKSFKKDYKARWYDFFEKKMDFLLFDSKISLGIFLWIRLFQTFWWQTKKVTLPQSGKGFKLVNLL